MAVQRVYACMAAQAIDFVLTVISWLVSFCLGAWMRLASIAPIMQTMKTWKGLVRKALTAHISQSKGDGSGRASDCCMRQHI